MSWIGERQQTWRATLVVLLLLSSIGPWALDKSHVPMQYACTDSIRLDGDFCGVPISGLRIFSWALSGIFASSNRLIIGDSAVIRELDDILMPLTLVLFILPIITMIALSLRKGRPSSWFNFGAVVIAILWGFFTATQGFSHIFWHQWGIWLYIGILLIALTLEGVNRRRAFTGPSIAS